MVTFERVNKFQYFCKNADPIIEEVTNVLSQITGGGDKLKDHVKATNEAVFVAILTRVVVREFFKQIKKLPDNLLTALVDVPYANDIYTISLGIAPDVEDGKDKIISSYYVK